MKNIFSEQKKLQLVDQFAQNRTHPKYLANLWKNKIPPSSIVYYAGKKIEWLWDWEKDKERMNPEYIGKTVIHTMDDDGYRIYPDYIPKSDKKLFCFGCSQTFGQSSMDNETWPYILAQKLGYWNVKNYGIGAGSIEAIARTCYQVINSLDKSEYPDLIYVVIPDPLRTEYIGNVIEHGKDSLYNWHICLRTYLHLKDLLDKEKVSDEHDSIKGKIYSYCKYTSRVHSFFEAVQHFRFLQETLNSTGIQWYWYSWQLAYCKFSKEDIINFFGDNTILDERGLKLIRLPDKEKNKYARDNCHYGSAYSNIISDEFLKLYKP